MAVPASALRRGNAFVRRVAVGVLLVTLVVSGVLVYQHQSRARAEREQRQQASSAAQDALQHAVELLWSGYLEWRGGEAGDLNDFRDFLDQNPVCPVPPWKPIVIPLGPYDLGKDVFAEVHVLRTDSPGSTQLEFCAWAEVSGKSEGHLAVYRAEGHPFKGLDFALLGSDLSCTFCHARVDSARNDVRALPYPRVRTASLESLTLPASEARLTVAGTLYTQGHLLDRDGRPLGDEVLSAPGMVLQALSFDPVTGRVDPRRPPVPLRGAPVDAGGRTPAGHSLYRQYPADPDKQPDGPLTRDFPAVFPDLDGDLVVNDAEYRQRASTATGSVSGLGVLVAPGGSLGRTSLAGCPPVAAQGSVEGNLVLTGTPSSPIHLEGEVAVNGDLVIRGEAAGRGVLAVRGNIYVAGDLVLEPGADGLTLAAGGNILVGDYLTPVGGDVRSARRIIAGSHEPGDPGRRFGFALAAMAVANRREWQQTQEALPGPPNAGTPLVPNSAHEKGARPRYYALDASSSVLAFLPASPGASPFWDDHQRAWVSQGGPPYPRAFDQVTALEAPLAGPVRPLNPTTPWVSPVQLKSFLVEDEMARAQGKPFQVDALLYTDGGIFGFTRLRSRTDGRLVFRGAVVARDVFLLAPGGLVVAYDERARSMLNLRDRSRVSLRRVLEMQAPRPQ